MKLKDCFSKTKMGNYLNVNKVKTEKLPCRRKGWFMKKSKKNSKLVLKETIKLNVTEKIESIGKDADTCKRDEVREDKKEKEIFDKFKKESIIEVPELHDGYMTVTDFKRCEKFLTNPHAVIPESLKPDVVLGYVKDNRETKNIWTTDMRNKNDKINEEGTGNKWEESPMIGLKIVNSNDSYQQRLDMEQKCMSVQAYANNAKKFTMSRLEKRKKRVTFMSLPNLHDINQQAKYQNRKIHEFSFTEIDELNELKTIEAECGSEKLQMQELKLNSGRRNSGQTETSTDSGQASSSATSASETRLKQPKCDRYFCSEDCTKCRAVYMEYMVEVYEPLIIRQIQVTDIIELLPVLDDRSKEILRNKHMQSPHGAMELLIKMIKQSAAPGKWQNFYDAVAETEFIYISMLLKEVTEVQYNYSSAVLSLIKPEIRSRIYFPEFLDKVFEAQLITETEKDEAESLNEIAGKTYILERVDKHLPKWDNVFSEILNESWMGDLAELFELVSQSSQATEPNLKMKETSHHRHTIRRRRQHIMKIAHGNPPNETNSNQMQNVPYFANGYGQSSENFTEIRVVMEKLVTDLASVVEELKTHPHTGENDSELCKTLLKQVVVGHKRMNNQLESLCMDMKNMKKEMSEMKECIKEQSQSLR